MDHNHTFAFWLADCDLHHMLLVQSWLSMVGSRNHRDEESRGQPKRYTHLPLVTVPHRSVTIRESDVWSAADWFFQYVILRRRCPETFVLIDQSSVETEEVLFVEPILDIDLRVQIPTIDTEIVAIRCGWIEPSQAHWFQRLVQTNEDPGEELLEATMILER